MSCPACDKITDFRIRDGCYTVRVGNGNVDVFGCREHVQELLRLVKVARQVEMPRAAGGSGG